MHNGGLKREQTAYRLMLRASLRCLRNHWFAVLTAALALTGIPSLALAHAGVTYTVEISEEGFSPNFLEILQGDAIEFVNTGELDHWPASNVHPTHEVYPDFDARRPILPGDSWTFTFFRPGLWPYHDHLNPQNTGELVVLPDTHQGQVAQPNNSGEAEGTGLVRLYNAARLFVTRLYEATRQLLAEAFGGPEVALEPDPGPSSTTELNTDFTPPPIVDFEAVYREIETDCETEDFDCFEGFFRRQVISNGPEIAVELVNRLREDGTVSAVVDEHQLAHRIGRQTAESYGVNEQAFLLCPMESLNGGCQHGFFEFVLGRTESTSEAADLICQSLQEGYSSKFQFYCYHGVGHGVMMAAAYDLTRALDTCDTFGTYMAQDGCWQGVFMENVNAGMGGYAREGVFSGIDPLEPCNVLDGKYQHECYINHAGYLMKFHDNDVRTASAACLKADDGDDVSSCLQSIGLMVTNPVWQVNFLEDFESLSFEDASWVICLMFPEGQLHECVLGAIDNIHNFDDKDLTRAVTFCNTVDKEYRTLCFERMGFNILNQTVNIEAAEAMCTELPDEFIDVCLFGAGIGVDS